MSTTTIHEHGVSELRPHPANISLYGEEAIPEDFIESIRTHGIIEPLLIKWDKTIISGHRRWLAAKKAGLATVPARTCDFADELEEIEMLISSNKQRVKTTTQIAREGAELQRIEGERARKRMEAGKRIDPTQNFGEGGETDEHVAKALGMSKEQWRKIRTVFEKAQSGDPDAQELMKALDAGEISVHRAYQEVKGRLDEALRSKPEPTVVEPPATARLRDQLESKERQIRELEKALLEEKYTSKKFVEIESLKWQLDEAKAEVAAARNSKQTVVEKVVEVVPPSVEAELNRLRMQYEDEQAHEERLENLQTEIARLQIKRGDGRTKNALYSLIDHIHGARTATEKILTMAKAGTLPPEHLDECEELFKALVATVNEGMNVVREARGVTADGAGLRLVK